MAMSVGTGGENDPMVEMNTTPLIDVMLVLLIMLIVTLPVMTHAVKLDMPRTDSPPPEVPPVVINVLIDYDGTIIWGETPATLKQVEKYFDAEAQKDPQPEVHIIPDPRVKYDYVEKVMASAQRSGIQKMGIINE